MGFDLMDTFVLLNHVYKSYQDIYTGLWLRGLFIVVAVSMWSFPPLMFVEKCINIRLLTWGAAWGTDSFDLVIKTKWFGSTKLLDPK